MCPKKYLLPKKVFVVNLFNQSSYPLLNTIVVIWAKVFQENFFVVVLKLLWELVFCSQIYSEYFYNCFYYIVFINYFYNKTCFGTSSVLFPTLITFYKIYCVFGITIKWFVNVINFVRILLFKSWSFFISLHKSQGSIYRMDQNCLLHLS